MNRITLAAFAILSVATPALASTDADVTLTITNDAGAVTMLRNMTQRECDAAVGLLSDRKSTGNYVTVTNATLSTFGVVYATAPHTPDVTKVECVRPTADKR
jgi:hypothetical protein